MPLWLGMVVLAIAIVLRVLPRLVWPRYHGTDAYYHQAYIRLIRETGHRLPQQNPRITGPGRHAYPALFHWALSFFNPGQVRWFDRFGGALGDLIVAVATSAVLYVHGAADLGQAFAVAGLYLFLPGLVLPHIGPRAFTLTPRVWGQAFYALAVVCWLVAETVPQAWALSVLPLALMLLTSKFAVQNLVFITPVVAVVTGRYEIALVAIAAAVLALVLFRAMFVRQLVGQLGHLTWYFRRNQGMVAHRNNWRALVDALRAANLRRLLVESLWHNPLVSGLVRHFPLILAIGLAWSSPGNYELALAFALSWVALVPWFLTAFGPARILGESERYLEFAAPAGWMLLWFTHPSPLVIAVVSLACLGGYVATVVFMSRTHRGFGSDAEGEVAHVLARERDVTLLCLHDPESYYFLAATDARLAKYNGDLTAFGDAGRFIARFFWRYPYVDPRSLKDLIEEGDVTHVLENRRGRDRFVASAGTDYDMTGLQEIFRNQAYVLYAARSAP